MKTRQYTRRMELRDEFQHGMRYVLVKGEDFTYFSKQEHAEIERKETGGIVYRLDEEGTLNYPV